MQTARIARVPALLVRLAALWVAAGAFLKLFAGSPSLLPLPVRELPIGQDLAFRLAIGIELVVVALAFLRPRWAWPLLAGTFAVFVGVLVLHVQRSVTGDAGFWETAMSGSCGCFGKALPLTPAVMMGIDAALLALLVASRPWRPLGQLGPLWLVAALSVVGAVAPWLVRSGEEAAAVTTDETGVARVEEARYVEIPLASWEGMCIYDIPFFNKFLSEEELGLLPIDGTYVFYRETCEHCAAHIAELANGDDFSRPFVFIRLPEEGVTDANRQVRVFPTGGHVTMLSLPEGTEWLLTTPADFQADGCIVSACREGIGL